MAARALLNARVDPDTFDALDRIAADRGTSRSELVREAIARMLDHPEHHDTEATG